MLPPAQLPISTLVDLNNDSLGSHLADRNTFPDVGSSSKLLVSVNYTYLGILPTAVVSSMTVLGSPRP